jgi:hypothetical protein
VALKACLGEEEKQLPAAVIPSESHLSERMRNKIRSSRLVDMKIQSVMLSLGATFFTRHQRPLENRPISDDLSALEEQQAVR